MLLRFIWCDNDFTRPERLKADEGATIRNIWIMFISILNRNYKPRERITVDEELFRYPGQTCFTTCDRNKDRAVYSSNFEFSKVATVWSYVPKKDKAVIIIIINAYITKDCQN